ncbi:MAG: glutamate 5-kinase [Gammaproteobacteria bacterium]|nr:glutamate 5-kinase [Rhodocyclaceae bacterium]MBU3908078.1 glutamate 5-kinase [Gammaproteobacteria bacterium]MBU3989567.1 glutamate 5-kinase [Gammaproteobacteria bacterium]MBU4005719.1 glutamate 5-kinase [Gammaproteobacteria bacterium]MBU4021533.1 glutamate 5-kinase [Gammaproteobacteria bacterium]
MRKSIATSKRIVVKVGSALVTNNGAGLAEDFIAECARQISMLHQSGRQIVLVSSGAIAAGMQRLGWAKRPHAMHALQAAAAVGQMGLTQAYESVFAQHGLKSAQVLLTHEDLSDRNRYLNARSTLNTLLDLGVVPIINENDTVVTDEIRFGDNDTLGALVANLIEAEVLIILTDQPGLFTADPRRDPHATLIAEGDAEDKHFESIAGGAGSGISKGGMITKIRAAQRAARSGAHTLIVGGRETGALIRAANGDAIGTCLRANKSPLAARKQWLADHLRLAGAVVIDDGAVNALRNGKSLLPIGVRSIEGEFERGAAIACLDLNRREVARGLINYASTEARRIAGHASQEIESLLGYLDESELVHRDNLVLV